MNELQDRLEKEVITRHFGMSVPEAYFSDFMNKVDSFCKARYGDVRWIMVLDLIEKADIDWKYAALFDEIEAVKGELASIKESKGVDVNQSPRVKTFGQKLDKREREEILSRTIRS